MSIDFERIKEGDVILLKNKTNNKEFYYLKVIKRTQGYIVFNKKGGVILLLQKPTTLK